MADTLRVPRAHLIMALCLPLAVILGYCLAEPGNLSSVGLIVLVLGLLAVPLLMKCQHALLVCGWNAWIVFSFLPGRPELWMFLVAGSLLFGVLKYAINRDNAFLYVPSLTLPLLAFAAVVLATAVMTGGVGLRILGSGRYGGRVFIQLLLAVGGYFALTSERIPVRRAGLYVGLFFLSGLTALVPHLADAAGSPFRFLFALFPVMGGIDLGGLPIGRFDRDTVRLGGLGPAALSFAGYLLARYGVRGVFDFSKPWRAFFFLLAAAGSLMSGYRTTLILFLLAFIGVFWLEGLLRTRALPILLAVGLVAGFLVLPQARHLPFVAQRALSFLPISAWTDPRVTADTSASSEWRVEMWRQVVTQIPSYLLKGRGYALDPDELYFSEAATLSGLAPASAKFIYSGTYHNGPLTVIIPLGIFGLAGFVWFLAAAVRALYQNYRFGDPALRQVNTLLLAFFVTRIVLFFVVFGSLPEDLPLFIGLAGLSVSLNGGVRRPATEEEGSAALEELEVASELRA